MPNRLEWNEAADVTIIQMRAYGGTWAGIARVLGLSRNTVLERGRRLGAIRPAQLTPQAPRPPEDEPNRAPLRAGHPISWGGLTDGTMLEGIAFVPLPPSRSEKRS